ncbi:MAG: HNH endonuclease signature motif containing protein [Candidatus Eisenbacteria bacterium]
MNHTPPPSALPIRKLTNAQLVERADLAVKREQASVIALLESLAEIDRRSLYLGQGYSSLFDYCTRRWGYSPATAGRYIAAARTAARFPRVRKLLEERRLTICTVSRLAGTLTEANCDELASCAAGKTFAEVESLVQTRRSAPHIPDRVRIVGTAPTRGTARAGANLAISLGANSGADLAEPTSSAEEPTDNQAGRDVAQRASRAETAKRCALNQRAPDRVFNRGVNSGANRPDDSAADQASHSADYQRGSTDPFAPRSPRELRYEIRFAARRAFVEKLERAKSVCSNKADLESVLERALDDLLDRRDPERRSKRRLDRRSKRRLHRSSNRRTESSPVYNPSARAVPTRPPAPTAGAVHPPERSAELSRTSTAVPCPAAVSPNDVARHRAATRRKPAPRTRHVPAEVRDNVFQRDGGQCTYVSPAGVRCAARVFLQLDHVVPYAAGGRHDEENLRIRCGRHNRARESIGGDVV